ncbi:DNA dC-_dU-editing enzyme APOBEC-3G [Rhinolophus sinicus]|uniref:DNA dC->dU-editing enzyme APOBEC-3G n=1 Tax=Rhinolophus sinicus TaxID=89399 RepID=UPI003D7BDB6C
MDAMPALEARPLMDKDTFLENFTHEVQPHKTYLCYEVELQEDDAWVPVDEYKGFLRNQGTDTMEPRCHAELCLLRLIRSWELNTEQHYRVTCFISWSPCHDCARELAAFLGKNSHLSLRIFASRIYTLGGYKTGLRQLQAAGAQVAIMASKEFEYCWETFVDHQGAAFLPWDDLDKHSKDLSKALKDILQNQEN